MPTSAAVPRPRAVALLLAFAVLAAACGGSSDAALPPPAVVAEPAPVLERGGLVVVLPAVDQLDPEERVRVRLLVERTVAATPLNGISLELIEPATAATVGAVVEAAARRVDAVCVLGAAGVAALVAVRELYPSLHGCVLPAVSGSLDAGTVTAITPPLVNGMEDDTSSSLMAAGEVAALDGIDVDLLEVGVTLGRSAREVAGAGIVVVLDGGDPLLDRRWALGVMEGAETRADGTAAAVRVVRSVDEVLALIGSGSSDGGSASSSTGPVPGVRRDSRVADEDPSGTALLPVGAIVLDASPGTDALATLLLDAGIPIVVPRSLVSERPDDAAIIARWRIRWDVALVPLLRRAAASIGTGSVPSSGPVAVEALEDLLALDEGPALVAARARLRSDVLG